MKNKKLKVFSLSVALFIALTVTAFAATSSSASFNTAGEADFGPESGSLSASFYPTYAKTTLSFWYSSSDATAIANYIKNDKYYAGVDVKNVPVDEANLGHDMMSAYAISTTLPDPKTDLENEDIFGDRNEEAEVVCLGTIAANKTYTMTVSWDDFREGNSTNSGQWSANAELSKKSIIDYNVVDWSGLVRLGYGPNSGEA